MNNIDFSKLGGFPVTQYTFDFLQKAYQQAFTGLANWFGDKVILYGVEPAGALLTDGLMMINGEPIFFEGGVATPYVDIFETPDDRLFEDGITKDVYFTRKAKSSAAAGYALADFVRPRTARDMQPYLAPVGAVIDFAGAVADIPAGWLLCDGSTPLIADYPALAAKLGTLYGGDGVSTFGLPNTLGRVSVGVDAGDADFDTPGKTGGEKKHTLLVAELPAHHHSIATGGDGAIDDIANGYIKARQNPDSRIESQNSGDTGANTPFNVMQPFIAFPKIIKF